jgi:hypothetical protein
MIDVKCVCLIFQMFSSMGTIKLCVCVCVCMAYCFRGVNFMLAFLDF